MLDWLKILLLGLVQGVTEWLPVSSTGHLILLERLFPLPVSEEFFALFSVVIQLGSILAVLVLYFRKLNPFALSKSVQEKKDTWTLWFKVVAAVLPSAVIGLLLDDWFDAHFYNYITVALTLVIYGVIFLFGEYLVHYLEWPFEPELSPAEGRLTTNATPADDVDEWDRIMSEFFIPWEGHPWPWHEMRTVTPDGGDYLIPCNYDKLVENGEG